MYPPQYYNLPPVDPTAFGGLPQEGGPQGQPPMDMNKYLIDKVMEIKSRMGGGGPGALGAISEAMMQQPQGGEIPPQQNMMA
tara:strand:- start:556 stop:801 length:246 start_codon:yes stop_codon:yes gene_type:complete